MLKAPAATQIRTCLSPLSAMQRITDALIGGHTWLITGTVAADKWPAVQAKFCDRYPTLKRNRGFVHRRKKAGDAAHRLVAFTPANDTRTTFYLLASAPDEQEKWANATIAGSRPELWSYVAMRSTKAGQAKPSWTWRLRSDVFLAHKEKLTEVLKNAPFPQLGPALTTIMEDAKKWPGFAGIRLQHAALRKQLTAEWRRYRRGSEPCPEWDRLRYSQRVKTR